MTQPENNLIEETDGAVRLWLIKDTYLEVWKKALSPAVAAWLERSRFRAKPGSFTVVPREDGALLGVAVGVSDPPQLWDLAAASADLPNGPYRLALKEIPELVLDNESITQLTLGWAFGTYRYDRYRKVDEKSGGAELVWPEGVNTAEVRRTISAVFLTRDLINTPAGDLGPSALAAAAIEVGTAGGADCEVIEGQELLSRGYPLIHAVGRAGSEAPRLVDLRWGNVNAPMVTLVGKGVCFDTGGLDLKSADGMMLMKKDMGGAAIALSLASMVMDAGLDLRLRVLLPIVENAIDGNAFHPGDVLPSRKGITVEIGNTDAEGRLILADALVEGGSESPDLLLDFATLTGSARIALGPDIPALFCPDDEFAAELATAGDAVLDPVWRMPLWNGYSAMLDSRIADINNVAASPFAGAITAALFLRNFVGKAKVWAHVDLFGWNHKSRPGRPIGGEAQVLRAAYRVLAARYGGVGE